jgi:hypothetical protein
VNSIARAGNSVSIYNPVALYIYSFNTASFMLDKAGDGTDLVPLPDGTITWQRGDITKNQGLRVSIQVPPGTLGNNGQPLSVSDIWDTNTGMHINYGAQFADYIKMTVGGVTIKGTAAPAQSCPGATQANLATNGQISNVETLVAKESVGTAKCHPAAHSRRGLHPKFSGRRVI